MFVHAHPDDESINNAATIAFYRKMGAFVSVVTCTRGEQGWALCEEASELVSWKQDKLGDYRSKELDSALTILDVSRHAFLGGLKRKYKDSRMMDPRTGNFHKDSLANADITEAARYLLKEIKKVKPQVIVTYDSNGGYGHVDHIKTHEITKLAFEMSQRDTRYAIRKIYWNIIPKYEILENMKIVAKSESRFHNLLMPEDYPYFQEDHKVTAKIDAREFQQVKRKALSCYRSQLFFDGELYSLDGDVGIFPSGIEYYRLGGSRDRVVRNDLIIELDLFGDF